MTRLAFLSRHCTLLAVLVLSAWAPAIVAAEFAILPLRVALDRTNRAAEVVVRNDDKAPLRMQVQAMAWRQDADGKDQYEPAEGVIYFPRTLEIPPGESRIVRVGIRAAPVTREETYRLFIEQLPPADQAPAPVGATLRVLLRVGVPVFVAPAQAERKAEVTRLDMKAGQVRWAVANAGNVHFVAERVELAALARDGTRLYSRQFQERYFLAGVAKPLQAEIPPELCAQVAALEASVVGEHLDLRRRVDVEPGSCK
jgi:fimbrial chaperone protein